jgi:hypothetical protein
MTYDYYVLWPIKTSVGSDCIQGRGPHSQDEAMRLAERSILAGQDDVMVIRAETKMLGKLTVTWEGPL